MTYGELNGYYKNFIIGAVMCQLDIAADLVGNPNNSMPEKTHDFFAKNCPNMPQDFVNKLIEARRIEKNHDNLLKQWDKLFHQYEEYITSIPAYKRAIVLAENNYKKEREKCKELETIYEDDTELPNFCLYLDKETGRYEMFCESHIGFDSEMAAKGFLIKTLDNFTEWMNKNGYETSHAFDYWNIFNSTSVFETQYDTVADAYYAFKNLVIGCSIDISNFNLKEYYQELIALKDE